MTGWKGAQAGQGQAAEAIRWRIERAQHTYVLLLTFKGVNRFFPERQWSKIFHEDVL